MQIKKNDKYIVTIEDMTTEGEGIGKIEGFPLFIKDSIIGDQVSVKVIKTKKNYGYARIEEVLVPSLDRIAPQCPVARQCGGCQLQAMSYPKQLEFKQKKVENNLKRIGGFVDQNVFPIIGMESPWRYRNKAQIPFGKDKNGGIIAGFYAGRTHAIIDQEDCLLSPEINAEIIRIIKKYMQDCHVEPYQENEHRGIVRHVLIRQAYRTNELMVCLIINSERLPKAAALVERLLAIPHMASISYSINQEQTNVILGKQVVDLYGPGYITDYIGDIQYQISPQSFFQVNPEQTRKLYDIVLEYAELTGKETVWDLYCGIGTISLFLAQKARKVYGVEIVEAAILDAENNAKINQIQNAEFFVGKAEEVLPEKYKKENIRAEVVIIDPPRKGCEPIVLETITQMKPQRVVYVSCDSATLARDLKWMQENGYGVRKVQPVDMFGMGVHCEVCVELCRR